MKQLIFVTSSQAYITSIPLKFELYNGNLLVDTLEGRNSLALSLVQSVSNDVTVTELDVGAVRIVLEGQSVLHPVVVITL